MREEVKLFEVRDRATCIPVMAIRISPDMDEASFLLRRAGFRDMKYVFVMRLEGGQVEWDSFHWGQGSRTMHEAHVYIEENWDELTDSEVIDVEFILKETDKPKMSERVFYDY